jgi:hypothetical protein
MEFPQLLVAGQGRQLFLMPMLVTTLLYSAVVLSIQRSAGHTTVKLHGRVVVRFARAPALLNDHELGHSGEKFIYPPFPTTRWIIVAHVAQNVRPLSQNAWHVHPCLFSQTQCSKAIFLRVILQFYYYIKIWQLKYIGERFSCFKHSLMFNFDLCFYHLCSQ